MWMFEKEIGPFHAFGWLLLTMMLLIVVACLKYVLS
jgi:hypothetical protein